MTQINGNGDMGRDQRRARINANFQAFQQYLAQVRQHVENREFNMAAIHGTVAAYQAANAHCGIFASAELEGILREIASQAVGADTERTLHRRPSVHEHVLHVATVAEPIGGLARMLRRWIEQDSRRRHSVVLTRQSTLPVPNWLLHAVQQRGGSIHFLDGVGGGLIHRARKLRKMARRYDYVVLHINPGDIPAFLAFATDDRSPPVIYLNHADHHFWLGVSISDVVANLRESGAKLSAERRGVDTSRNMILPTLLLPVKRTLSQSEAKLRLGFNPDQILLISVARRIKYASRTGRNFLDIHLPILQQHDARLVVIGAGCPDDWRDAISLSEGRVISLEEQENVDLYFEASDIYIDSYPFVSITSLLEAGQYGVPLISRFPYTDASRMLGANMPGLAGTLVVARTDREYVNQLSWLITNENARRRLGEETCTNIERHHVGDNWTAAVNAIYHQAKNIKGVPGIQKWTDEPHDGEPDVLIEEVLRPKFDEQATLSYEIGVMPLRQRLESWRRFYQGRPRSDFGRFGPLVYLLPEWMLCRVGRFRRSMVKTLQ